MNSLPNPQASPPEGAEAQSRGPAEADHHPGGAAGARQDLPVQQDHVLPELVSNTDFPVQRDHVPHELVSNTKPCVQQDYVLPELVSTMTPALTLARTGDTIGLLSPDTSQLQAPAGLSF